MTGLDPGAHFAGHRIEALIGRGGMGEVYRAVHVGLERTVALKVVAPNLAEEEGIRERFRRECRLAAAIDHPAAVPIYDSGEFEGRLYVTMRLVQGPDLGRQVRRDGPLTPEWAAELSARAAEAIDAAHRHGLVHRDIKPANLLLEAAENDMRVFVGDFGLAKLLDDSSGPTKTGTWLGTVDYAAPETLAGKGAGPAADVYGLGGVLYTALTGRAPYVRDTLSGVMWAHTNDPPPQLGDLRHPATDALNDVIARAMAKEPAERFGSGAELAAALRAAVPDGERRPFALAPAMAASLETETSAETRTGGEASTPELPGIGDRALPQAGAGRRGGRRRGDRRDRGDPADGRRRPGRREELHRGGGAHAQRLGRHRRRRRHAVEHRQPQADPGPGRPRREADGRGRSSRSASSPTATTCGSPTATASSATTPPSASRWAG